MKFYEVEINGEWQMVPAEKVGRTLWFHWQGKTYSYQPEVKSRGKQGRAAAASPGLLKSPMPGKITKVAIQRGDEVQKGDLLLVMEAMKMEYTMEADMDGVVQECNVRQGQQVSLGEILVKVSSEEG